MRFYFWLGMLLSAGLGYRANRAYASGHSEGVDVINAQEKVAEETRRWRRATN
jgi:hypothetical protein